MFLAPPPGMESWSARTLVATVLALASLGTAGAGAGAGAAPESVASPGASDALRVAIVADGHSWLLAKSFFIRQTHPELKIPSWTGLYRSTRQVPDGGVGDKIRVQVYFFADDQQSKNLLVDPKGSRFPKRADGLVPGSEEVFVVESASPSGGGEVRHRYDEIRVRRKSLVFRLGRQPPGTGLVAFARQFIERYRVLGEWSEVSLTVKATNGHEHQIPVTGGIQVDETWRGWMKMVPETKVELAFHLKKVTIQADNQGLRPIGTTPVSDATLSLETLEEIVDSRTDPLGIARVRFDRLNQRRALEIAVRGPGLPRPITGTLRLRFGESKEKLIDEGRYGTTAAPRSSAIQEVGDRFLDFLGSIFNEDWGAFPATLDEDRLGPIVASPLPHFLHVTAWHLTKKLDRPEMAEEMKACLPLDLSHHIGGGEEEVRLKRDFDTPEAALALNLETADPAWLELARTQFLDRLEEGLVQGEWTGNSARRVLGLWRIQEILEDVGLEAEALEASRSLLAAIQKSAEPTVFREAGGQTSKVHGSGNPAPHAWATLALVKASERTGDQDHLKAAVFQATHMLDKHVSKGRLIFSHIKDGEEPGEAAANGHGPGAYPELTAAIHALLLIAERTGNKSFHNAAMQMRARVLGYWRQDNAGFGKLQYWDGPLATRAGAQPPTVPINSRRGASIYQQAWAVLAFLPRFYPYWGEGVLEAKEPKKVLDILFPKSRRKLRRAGP